MFVMCRLDLGCKNINTTRELVDEGNDVVQSLLCVIDF